MYLIGTFWVVTKLENEVIKIEIAVQSILVIKAWDSKLANKLMPDDIGGQSFL